MGTQLSSRKPQSGYPGSIKHGLAFHGSRLSPGSRPGSAGMTGGASGRLALRGRGQERVIEHVRALRLDVLERVGECDLVERLLEPLHVDVAVAVLLHLGGEDV